MRLLKGGNAGTGPFLQSPWRGSRVPYVCANVIEKRTGHTLLPPYAVVVIHGVPVGIIGAVLKQTPTLAPAWATANLRFTDEATAINAAARELQAHGVHILVTIHQGVRRRPRSTALSGTDLGRASSRTWIRGSTWSSPAIPSTAPMR